MKQGKDDQSSVKRRHLLQQTPFSKNPRYESMHGHHQMVITEMRLIIFITAKDGEALYSQQEHDLEVTVAQSINSLLQNAGLN